MSSVAQSARLAGRVERHERRRGNQRLLGGGVLWIVLFAALLAGVVAVNVAVLRLNLQLDGTARERTQLGADIAQLRSQLSSAAATDRIETKARTELGLVQADPTTTVYVQLRAK